MNWYYSNAGQQAGPVSEEEFQNLVRAGTIKADTLVWREGMANWVPYNTLSAPGTEPTAPSPLAPPAQPSLLSGFDTGSRARAEQMVSGPAICLIIVGAIGIVLSLAGLVMNLTGMTLPFMFPQGGGGMDPQVAQMMRMFGGSMGIISGIIGIVVAAFIIYGGMQMKKLQSQGLVMGSAIVAMIPCVSPCCLIGIPIGVWALVVLNKPEVKSQFG